MTKNVKYTSEHMLITKYNNVENASKIVEERYGIKLPYVYARFLDRYNGGSTYKTKVYDAKIPDRIMAFYGIKNINDIIYSFEEMDENGVIERLLKKELFPIATNINGDYFCICIDGDKYGAIYIVYHDMGYRKRKIFDSFKDFIEKSVSEPIGHIPTMEEREATAIANGFADEVEDLRPIWKEEIEKFSNLVQEEVILEDEE